MITDKNGVAEAVFLGELTMDSPGFIVGRKSDEGIVIGHFGAIGYEIRSRRKKGERWLPVSHLDLHFDGRPEFLSLGQEGKSKIIVPILAFNKAEISGMLEWLVEFEYRVGVRVRDANGRFTTVFAKDIIDGRSLAEILRRELEGKEREKGEKGEKEDG